MLGYNYRLSEIHAAIGRLQLKEVSKWNDKRKEIHAVYKRILGCHLINYEPSLHTYALVYVMQFCRDNLVKHLVKKGIECKSLYDYALDNSCSEAVLFSKCNVWLPCHASLSVSDAEYIAKVVKKFIEGECNGTICANEKM
jgi:perosamine synthetase